MEMALAVADVLPPRLVLLPPAVITPLALTDRLETILVWLPSELLMTQVFGRMAETSAPAALETASVTVVRQDDAAKMTSETRARTV